jgi:hypothetical protein
MWRVNFLAGFAFDVANGEHVARALTQQPHELRVELVNRLAMFGNVQNEGRMKNFE